MPPPALDYAPPPSARRRWMRRLRRGGPVGLLLIVAGLGIAYGPGIWRRWQVITLQEACITAEMPTDRPVYEGDPAAAKALIAARPGEYNVDWTGGVSLAADPRWVTLSGALGVNAWPQFQSGSRPTLFCHERRTPDGRRRLVVVEGLSSVTVISTAAWPVGEGPRVVRREEAKWDKSSDAAHCAADLPSYPIVHLRAGLLDPVDPARFIASFTKNGIPGTWEYRLGNDDRVTMRLLDPEGFIARANAAKARAATQPAP